MTKTYVYKGTVETEMPGVGVVQPNQEVHTEKVINHPLFELKKEPDTRTIRNKLKIKTK